MAKIRQIFALVGHKIEAGCTYAHHLETGIVHFNELPCDVRAKIIADCGQLLMEAGFNFIEETGELIDMEAETLRSLMEDVSALEQFGERIDGEAHPGPGL